MFEMTRGAVLDAGVKCGRLSLQQPFVICVANDAVLRLDALGWRVTGGAFVFKKGVRLREFSRNDRALNRDLCAREVHDGERRRCKPDTDERNRE